MKLNTLFKGRYGHVLLGVCLGLAIVLLFALYNLLASGGPQDEDDNPDQAQEKQQQHGPDTTDIVGDYFFRVPKSDRMSKAENAEVGSENEETVNLQDVANDQGENIDAETSNSDIPAAASAQQSAPAQSQSAPQDASSKQPQQSSATASKASQQQRKAVGSKIHPTIEKLEN